VFLTDGCFVAGAAVALVEDVFSPMAAEAATAAASAAKTTP